MLYSRGRSAVRVGTLALVGAAAFTALFIHSTNRVLGAERATIFVRLGRADGLQRGDAVLHRGVGVGSVRAIEFGPAGVVVRVRLGRTVPVSSAARAQLVAADLFGRQSLVIDEGERSGRPLTDGDTISGTTPPAMTARLEDLGGRIGDLLSDRTIEGIRKTLHGASSATTSTARAADEIGGLARAARTALGEQSVALADLTRDAQRLARNLDAVTRPEELETLRDALQQSAGSLASATATLDGATSRLLHILDGLEQGRGSAGRLLTDDALYERATGSLAALERLLDDVRQNPRRYVTVRIF